METRPRPAHDTKHLPVLHYAFHSRTYQLHQSQSSGETGSTLWLSSQILAEYLFATLAFRKGNRTAKCLELGSGIGLLALVLRDFCKFGAVVATDQAAVCPLLSLNLQLNTSSEDDIIRVETLDWCAPYSRSEQVQGYHIIVMTDVIYAQSLIHGLLDTLLKDCQAKTVIYLAQEVRVPELMNTFLDLASAHFKIQQVGKMEVGKIIEKLTRNRDSCHDGDGSYAEQGRGEEEGDWSGVSIYKMRLKARLPYMPSRSSTMR